MKDGKGAPLAYIPLRLGGRAGRRARRARHPTAALHGLPRRGLSAVRRRQGRRRPRRGAAPPRAVPAGGPQEGALSRARDRGACRTPSPAPAVASSSRTTRSRGSAARSSSAGRSPRTSPKDYPWRVCGCPGRLWLADRRDPTLVRVERNFLHHNAMSGGGYGVVVGGGVYATVEGNVLAFNNHSIAADGQAYSGYSARFNYILRGVLTYGTDAPYPHSIDVHGRRRSRTTATTPAAPAGTYFDVSFNTVLGEQDLRRLGTPDARRFRLARPAGAGCPLHRQRSCPRRLRRGGEAESRRRSAGSTRTGRRLPNLRLARQPLRHRLLHDSPPATSTATARPTSSRQRHGLVLLARRQAALGVSACLDQAHPGAGLRRHRQRRRAPTCSTATRNGNAGLPRERPRRLVQLTTVPVPIKDLRFGDFDGDGKTDIFYTRPGPVVASGTARRKQWDVVTDLEQADRGASVRRVRRRAWHRRRAVLSDRWAYRAAPRRRGIASTSSSHDVHERVAADFDGNGRTDIAIGDGQTWRYSRDGRSRSRCCGMATRGCPTARQPAARSGRFDGGTTPSGHQLQPHCPGHSGQRPYSARRVARHVARPGRRQQVQRALLADHALSTTSARALHPGLIHPAAR